MGVFDGSIALAQRLVKKYGEAATLRRSTAPVVDAAKPWRPAAGAPATEDQAGVRAVFLDLGMQGSEPQRFADGTQVRVGDKQVYIAAQGLTFAPELNHLLIRADGSKWTVKTVKVLDPNGQQILYELWVTQ